MTCDPYWRELEPDSNETQQVNVAAEAHFYDYLNKKNNNNTVRRKL